MATLGEVPLFAFHQQATPMDYFLPCLLSAWIIYLFDLYLSRRQVN